MVNTDSSPLCILQVEHAFIDSGYSELVSHEDSMLHLKPPDHHNRCSDIPSFQDFFSGKTFKTSHKKSNYYAWIAHYLYTVSKYIQACFWSLLVRAGFLLFGRASLPGRQQSKKAAHLASPSISLKRINILHFNHAIYRPYLNIYSGMFLLSLTIYYLLLAEANLFSLEIFIFTLTFERNLPPTPNCFHLSCGAITIDFWNILWLFSLTNICLMSKGECFSILQFTCRRPGSLNCCLWA